MHIRWIGTERPQADYIDAGEQLGQLARQTLGVLDWQRLIVVYEKNGIHPFQFNLIAVTGKSKKTRRRLLAPLTEALSILARVSPHPR